MGRLSASWWLMIAFMLVFELLATLFLDYWHDPMASIICIHLFPVIAIVAILIWGPAKKK